MDSKAHISIRPFIKTKEAFYFNSHIHESTSTMEEFQFPLSLGDNILRNQLKNRTMNQVNK